jgi:NADPH:quinone reductase-like Zn-dependent oxidoreductase
MLVSMVVKQQAKPSVKTQNSGDLAALKALVEAGSLTPVIDRTFALRETPQANAHVAAGHARGTAVLSIASEAPAA